MLTDLFLQTAYIQGSDHLSRNDVCNTFHQSEQTLYQPSFSSMMVTLEVELESGSKRERERERILI